jgi:UDP-N-acetyl-D-galactosamine dehydrogenase
MEDVPDIRNSMVLDVVNELKEFGVEIHIHDPAANAEEAMHEYGVKLEAWHDLPAADALILAVAHRSYKELPKEDLLKKVVRQGVVIDIKSVLDAEALCQQGIRVWRL